MTNYKTQREIEKEFDEKFTPDWWMGLGTSDDINKKGIDSIKSFIHQIRQDDIKSLIEQLEKEKKDSLWVGEDPETEEMKVMEPNQMWGDDMSFAYNLALDNVISYLKSQLKS